MAYLTTEERAAIQAQITIKVEQLEEANETMRRLLKQDVSEYRFDTTEGAQRVSKVKILDLQNVIEALESQLDILYRKLGSGGLRTLNLRRKGAYWDFGLRRS